MSRSTRTHLPRWIKVLYTVWVVILIPVWVDHQGWNNFLWLSDIGFLGTCIALWLESRFLASMLAVGIVLPDLGWSLHFFADLIVDSGPLVQAGYMFNEEIPLFVRGLSLFHVVVPLLLTWMVYRLGYDRRGLAAQTLLIWLVLPVCFFFTDPAESINFVHGFGEPPQPPVPQPWWLALQLILAPAGFCLPTHLLLAKWFASPADQ